MAWAYRRPGDPTSGQVWVDADDPNALPDTVPIDTGPAPTAPIQITGQSPEAYERQQQPVTYDQPTTAPTYQTWGSHPYEGWDAQKIASDHSSPKYQVGRVLSNFDPRAGITPDVIAALNALGIGTFEGSGQNLRVLNASPAFEGYTDWGDMIHGYQGGAGAQAAWQYGIHNSRDLAPAYTDPGATEYGGGGNHLIPTPGQGISGGADPNTDPFAAMGGGVWIDSLKMWVPRDHPMASMGSSSSSSTTTTDGTIQSEARQRILDLLRTPQTVNAATLRDTPEMQAVYLQQQRAQERDRAALAERAAAGGWSGSGGFEGGLQALNEKRGATEMTLMSQLATEYMERNREDLKAGIEFALNQGQFDQAQALQRELAALEAAIEREKIGANLSMNTADNALQRELGLKDLSLRQWLGAQGLGFDYAKLQAESDREAAKYLYPDYWG